MSVHSRPGKAKVFVLTGFLGAGKTTLLNRILTAQHGRRIAVIVNEFGEVGIDHHLLISSDQQVVQMNNGCICCTVRGDLLRSLFELLDRRSQFDTIVIETTGLAEPAPVVHSLYADERVRSECTLQGVITVVDAKHVAAQLKESCEAHEQIAFADLILLNKTDLSTPEVLDDLEKEIRHVNKVANIIRTRNAEMDVAEILDMAHISVERVVEAHRHHDVSHDHNSHDDRGHGHHHNHLQHVETICLVDPGALDGLKLSNWFQSLATQYGAKILRMKGILDLWGDPDQFLFQGVQTEMECRPGRPWAEGEERLNRLVFIGRGLDEAAIKQGFKGCVSKDTRPPNHRPDNFGRWHAEISPLRLDQIRFWMRQNFGYAKDIPIVIKEVPCGKPGCPPIETAIMALLPHEPPRLFKVQASIDSLTYDHVYDLMENPMPCC